MSHVETLFLDLAHLIPPPLFFSWIPFTVQRSVCWVNLKLYNGLETHPECTLPVTAGTDSSHTPS